MPEFSIAQIRQYLAIFFILFFLILLYSRIKASERVKTFNSLQKPQNLEHLKFSFRPTFTYSKKLKSSNLNQVYYVSEKALHYFTLFDNDYQAQEAKLTTDDRVENEIISQLDK